MAPKFKIGDKLIRKKIFNDYHQRVPYHEILIREVKMNYGDRPVYTIDTGNNVMLLYVDTVDKLYTIIINYNKIWNNLNV